MRVQATRRVVFLASTIMAAMLDACAGSPSVPQGTPVVVDPGDPTTAARSASPIDHVIVVVQENRSFDNLFYGFPGADTATSGTLHDGTQVALKPIPLEDGRDIGHFHFSFDVAYDAGKMDGFDLQQGYAITNGAYGVVPQDPTYPYAYVPRSESQPYFDLASRYTLGDRMFASNNGPSFPAHQYLIAGQSSDADEVPSSSPWGCDSPAGSVVAQIGADGRDTTGVFPCFDYETIGDVLTRANRTWRAYAPALETPAGGTFATAFDAVAHIRNGSAWSNVVSPETTIFNDLTNRTLADFSFVTPSFLNSDHPLGRASNGPSWVASIVDAVGASPYWKSTAIVVTWDDWGGWYDHVSPQQLDAMGLGFRVPLIVISPYAKHGYVSHVGHEFGSILHFTETTFGLPSLGQVDARADDLSDCFDFTQTVRPFVPLATRLRARDFIAQPQTGEPADPI